MNVRNRTTLALPCLVLMAVLTLPVSLIAAAQEASPAASPLLTGLGLPTLEYTVTNDGIEMPSEIAAGPVLITGANQADGYLVIDLVQLPPEGSIEEFVAVGSSADAPIPAWGADLVITGGMSLEPGATSSVVALLAPGEYLAIAAGDVAVANPAATLTVTGELAANVADTVPSDLTVTLGEYVFDFPETVAAGSQVWRITNTHEATPHHAVVLQVDRAYSQDEIVTGLAGLFSGTPVVDGFTFESIVEDALGSSVLSSGQTVWAEVDLAPGHYVAICFLPDPGSDMPHVMQGMVDTFEVTVS